jgi:two-component system sensor histidine kinase/response regulator
MKRDILYVDDEPDNIVVFEATFEDDFNVLTAESGKQALEMMDRHPVPVVVADQRMPNMTGVELCEILRDRFSRD